jgi:hypothetical protein
VTEHEDMLLVLQPRQFVADCLEKIEKKDNYKHKSRTDDKYRSRRDHKSK